MDASHKLTRWIAACAIVLGSIPSAFGAGGTGCTSNCGGGGGVVTPPNWKAYGFTMATDPVYGGGPDGFTSSNGWANYLLNADPETQDQLGLVAKGNVIMGDYTDPDFQTYVAPRLSPGVDSVVQPYAIDATDAALGYSNYPADDQGRPRFSGAYTQVDGGQKTDGTPRKFYESTLKDTDFMREIIKARLNDQAFNAYGANYGTFIDAAMFTNHAMASLAETRYFIINGAVVARDDAMVFSRSMNIDYDVRLLGDASMDMALPYALKRLSLVDWSECPYSGCPE